MFFLGRPLRRSGSFRNGNGATLALLVLALIALDVVIYLPFVKAYDANLLAEEANSQQEEPNTIEESKPSLEKSEIDPLNVLVLCVGAGTSAMFANAVNKGAEIKDLPVKAQAEAFGGHTGVLSEVQLVVLSPQVQSRYDEIKADADRYGIKVVKTKGAQYIGLTKDPEGAVDFVVNQANTKKNKSKSMDCLSKIAVLERLFMDESN